MSVPRLFGRGHRVILRGLAPCATFALAACTQDTDDPAPEEEPTVGDVAQVIDEGGDTMEVDIFGHYQGDVPVPEDQENPEGMVPITCTDDRLTYEIEGYTIVWHRMDGWD